jgi:hypothetical protein
MGESCDEKLQVPGPQPCDSLHALSFLAMWLCAFSFFGWGTEHSWNRSFDYLDSRSL